jgi:hypothetical protein
MHADYIANVSCSLQAVLLDYVFGTAVLTRWGFKADALLSPERMPTFPTPVKITSHPKIPRTLEDRTRPVTKREAQAEALERAEMLMALIAANTPRGRAHAEAQAREETAQRASIEDWVRGTRK